MRRKFGSGRHKTVNFEAVEKWFVELSDSLNGIWTVLEMVEKMKEEWGFGSHGSVMTLINRLNFRSVVRRLRPLLTEENREKRRRWSQLNVMEDEPFGDKDCVFVHVDEKWFYGVNAVKRTWKRAKRDGEENSDESGDDEIKKNSIAVGSKRFLNKIMFLAAVAVLRPEHHFDGMIGFYGLVKHIAAKRASNNRPRGARTIKLVNMDKKNFVLLMKRVIKDASRKCPWANCIVVQMDNAGGHGGGRGDIALSTLNPLNSWANGLPDELLKLLNDPDNPPNIEFIAQPPHSPDLNVLDLGAWRSLDVAVDKVKRDRMGRQLNNIEIYHAARDAWRSWAGAEKLTALFDTLQMTWRCIIECNGANTYKLPHHRDMPH